MENATHQLFTPHPKREMIAAKPVSPKMGLDVFYNSWLMTTRFSFKGNKSKKTTLVEDSDVENVVLLKKSSFKLVKLYQRTLSAARGKMV